MNVGLQWQTDIGLLLLGIIMWLCKICKYPVNHKNHFGIIDHIPKPRWHNPKKALEEARKILPPDEFKKYIKNILGV